MMAAYLLHFEAPIAPGRHTCQHYIGSAKRLRVRIAEHRAGRGARLTQVALERGIAFTVGRGPKGAAN
jgi:predicted GIY-YIG superfamily endonuclease